MRKSVLLLFLYPLSLFGVSSDYDIVPRTVNFLIFIAILYYFTAPSLKSFYKNRIIRISSKLDEIQKRLLESKTKKLNTLKKLEEAKANSVAALILAKKEAEILVHNIQIQTQEECSLLERHFEEHKEYELRKMEKEVISKALDTIFSDESFMLQQHDIVEIMMKKVS
ncbi:F0F1 ATP synthase subunit B [Campylobacter sp. MIT 21-1685]|uniref:F0F1 ATP synthase subunit B n=1 Tax=unclassified Campylobacter TaxID=2593542 RepID=UPI00224A59F3|nr:MULTISPECIES: F0F1 ATP synthase subunit B [unclassified Campylobacter]MCX2683337.1 F0F1 ATP synthase subunit B [Campylobacter sp. MIT 21-1684]MCX2751608.1 F0F1 ATP synthase subunit B [Campylobacter sp. MIT 21-1682]MCX2807807.1 F0F1 ATP synthase subunit B [Campylobacter sp. MIT 21-1685]